MAAEEDLGLINHWLEARVLEEAAVCPFPRGRMKVNYVAEVGVQHLLSQKHFQK